MKVLLTLPHTIWRLPFIIDVTGGVGGVIMDKKGGFLDLKNLKIVMCNKQKCPTVSLWWHKQAQSPRTHFLSTNLKLISWMRVRYQTVSSQRGATHVVRYNQQTRNAWIFANQSHILLNPLLSLQNTRRNQFLMRLFGILPEVKWTNQKARNIIFNDHYWSCFKPLFFFLRCETLVLFEGLPRS